MLNFVKFFVYTTTLFFCSFSFGQTEIHCWNFNGSTPFNSPVNTDNRVIGNGQITYTISDVQNFAGNTANSCSAVAAGNAFCPRGTNGTSMTLAFPSTGFQNLQLSFWCRRTSTGFSNNNISYSIDGGASFIPLAGSNFTPLDATAGSVLTFSFTGIAGADNNPNFQIRITFNGATNTTGNNRYDNIRLVGDNIVTNTINTSNPSPLTFNVDCSTGDNGTVAFTSSGVFTAGNVFTAELSDASGSFASPLTVGNLTLSGTNPSGTINITIPLGTPNGTAYRIRVVSNNPSTIGTVNSTNLTINLSGGPCVFEPPHITSLIINSCNTACDEGNNEVIFANTGDYSVLMNSANFEVTYGNSPSPTTVYTNPLVNNAGTTNDLNTDAGCPGLFVDATNATIPPNSIIMLAHDQICSGDVLDFGNLCGSGPIYVVYTQDPSWSLTGNFVNDPGCSGGIRYLTSTITSTDGTSHVIDYSFDCTLNSGTDGDYAKWNYLGGAAIEQGNNGCTLEPVVLPISLGQYSGSYNGSSTDLIWTTLSEQNNDYFEILHSSNGIIFESIGKVPGSGNTVSTIDYSFNHRTPHSGINYYKLMSFDYDGTTYDKGLVAVSVEMSHIFFDQITQSIRMNYPSDYAVYSSDGRLVKRVSNQDYIPFTGYGIFHVIDERSGKAFKLGIW